MRKYLVFICIGIVFLSICCIFFDKILQYAFFVKSYLNHLKVSIYTEKIIKDNLYRKNGPYDTLTYTWDTEAVGKARKTWKYYNGLMMTAILRTGHNKDIVDKFYSDNISEDGSVNNIRNKINIYQKGTIDDIAPARTLFFLLNTSNGEKYRLCLKKVKHELTLQPILYGVGNNYIHKVDDKKWKKYQFALDGLYVTLPFQLEYDKYVLKNIDKSNYDIAFNRANWVSKNLKNKEGLYCHGCKKDGTLNGVVWLRGVGWYAMAQLDTIALLPEGEQKEIMKKQLAEFFDVMLEYQDKQNGMWYNVIYPDDKTIECNIFESSGTAIMAYALMEAYLSGIIADEKYAIAGLKAFNGVVGNKLKFLKGKYVLKDVYKSSSVHNNVQDYCVCSKYVDDEAKGIAPLIMASSLVSKTIKNIAVKNGKNHDIIGK